MGLLPLFFCGLGAVILNSGKLSFGWSIGIQSQFTDLNSNLAAERKEWCVNVFMHACGLA